ncbi:MAG: BON domain-containing protein [Pseudomonas sp.]|uniref:BON domain-containing protein n=1 Tax=Pseudomonas sp. TaxID=306 RepID=UPI003BB76D4F
MYKQPRTLMIATGIALSIAAMSTAAIAGVSQDVTDARQEAQIWTTYTLSPYLRANNLSVSVHEGKATLTGKVNEDVNKDLAKQIALGVNGIKEVDNQIVVLADYEPTPGTVRGYGQVVDDASITAAIKSKLVWSKHTDGQTTAVETNAGKVTLTGTVQSANAKDAAERLALDTTGVVAVSNQLVVSTATPSLTDKAKNSTAQAGREISDSWITTKIKSTLLYSSNVKGSDVEVSTKGGVVTLSGKLGSGAERALAVELADNVRGVKAVNAKALTF